MRRNILNKDGLLTDEDIKEGYVQTYGNFTFHTCLDLSEPVKIVPLGTRTEYTLQGYSKDLSSFISNWTYFVKRDLNGFTGFYHVKFELVNFKLIGDVK